MAPDTILIEQELTETGQRFTAALAERDFHSLLAFFHPGVRARLLIPAGLVTPLDAAGLINKYRQWFGEAVFFEMQGVVITCVGRRLGIFHRVLLLKDADRWSVLEQQTYSSLANGRIERFDLLCSGFEPGPALEGG
jgi:hypothetical protein